MIDKEVPKQDRNQDIEKDSESLKNNPESHLMMDGRTRVCTYCGNQVAVGDTHCHKCGVEYEQE